MSYFAHFGRDIHGRRHVNEYPEPLRPGNYATERHRPYPRSLLRFVNSAAARWSRMSGPLVRLDFERLLDAACRRTGLTEFGDPWFKAPLRVLLTALEREANLTFIGRLAMSRDVLRLLSQRLRLIEDRRRDPHIAEQVIRQPIFIVGLPRTGSTFLHNLLAQDPRHRVPFTWEVLFPTPSVSGRHHDAGRLRTTQGLLDAFDRLAPEFKRVHPMKAEWPTECVSIMAYAFASYQFQSTCRLPSYQQWLAQADLTPAYVYHREVLQHMQRRWCGERWVLKAPAHTFALDALSTCYPDARFVQTHRDPVQVIASVASLDAILRQAFSDDVRLQGIGLEAVEQWADAASRVITARDRHLESRFHDVYYPDLVREPIRTVRELYAALGLVWSDEVEARMRHFLAQPQPDGQSAYRPPLNAFGLTSELIVDRFREYCRRFNVTSARGLPSKLERWPEPAASL